MILSDFFLDIFVDDVIFINKSSLFVKFSVICIESLFLRFNGNFKMLLIGSLGSDKYYELENEYFIVNISNGNI